MGSYPGEPHLMKGSINEDFDSYRLVSFTQPKGMYVFLAVKFNLNCGEAC